MASTFSCCTLFVGGVLSGVYTTAAYLAAFCMEIAWIVELNGKIPAPSYALMAGYFFVLIVSVVLLVGLVKKLAKFLLIWLFLMGIFFIPECGIVLYMALHYWGISTDNGITELTFYSFRAVLNVFAFICIQFLLRRWQQEKAVMRRLEFLNIGPLYSSINGTGVMKSDNEMGNGHATMMAYSNPCPIEIEVSPPKRRSIAPGTPDQNSWRRQPKGSENGDATGRTLGHDHFLVRGYWSSGRSEFDATSFNEYIQQHSSGRAATEINFPVSRSNLDLPTTVFSLEGGWDQAGSPGSYATHSLDRPKFRQNNFGSRTRSLEDISRTHQVPGGVMLEKLEEQPFQYLHRPGNFRRDESDCSDTNSIRDIAL